MDGRAAAATLGVEPGATRDEIRRAFRARVKRAHPDVGGDGSPEAFITLRAAFDLLMSTAPASAPPAPPSPPAPPPPAPRPRPASSSWPERVASRRSPLVDLTDVGSSTLARPAAAGSIRERRVAARPVGSVRRDRRGLSFDDHLSAALAALG